MTINDLAFEMISDKEDTDGIKKLERQIKSWENEKSYPTLEDIYLLAYTIKINPGELLAIRNRGRKQFYRESDDPPKKRHDWIEISDNASIIFSSFMKLFGLVTIVIVVVVGYKFYDVFLGGTATEIEKSVIEMQIDKHTNPENIINDGTVANMLRRKRRESGEGKLVTDEDNSETSSENTVENKIENIIEN